MPRRLYQDGPGDDLIAVLAGIFLIAHGLVHIVVWVAPPPPDAPFDSRHSWLLGEAAPLAKALAVISCVLFVPAGVLVLAGAGLGGALAVAGAAVSLTLVLLTFHPWFLIAIAINIAIAVVALS
jgi:hypothetical protein